MNDDLVTYLDSIDERLLDYLDEDEELSPGVVQRLHHYVVALADGSLTPTHVMEDWADFYDLAAAFVVAYGTEELVDLYEGASFLEAVGEGRDVALTDADRRFLVVLADELGHYPELLRP